MNTHDLAKLLLAVPAAPIDHSFGSSGGIKTEDAVRTTDGQRVFISVYPSKTAAAPKAASPKPAAPVVRTKAVKAQTPATPEAAAPTSSEARMAAMEAKLNTLIEALGGK